MQCPKCHTQQTQKSQTCSYCGAPLNPYRTLIGVVGLVIALITTFLLLNMHNSSEDYPKFGQNLPDSPIIDIIDTSNTNPKSMITLWNTGHYNEAFQQALKVGSRDTLNLTAQYIQALFWYNSGGIDRSLRFFTKLQSDTTYRDNVLVWIKKIRLKQAERDRLSRCASEHFFIRYEGTTAFSYCDTIITLFENAASTLSQKLSYYPVDPFEVILFHDPIFKGLHTIPEWAAAHFDGAIRIPVQSLTTYPSLKTLVIHELTHAYLSQINPLIPSWIHEGTAQYFDQTHTDSSLVTAMTWPTPSTMQLPFSTATEHTQVSLRYHIALQLITTLFNNNPIQLFKPFVIEYDKEKPDYALKKHYDITFEKLYSVTHARWRPEE
ncbi:MAG: zinc ribbon domain-containing protein [Fibrobacterales bacterium]